MKQSLPLSAVLIDDFYWNRYTKLIPDKVIPYQWEILNDRVANAPPSYCLENFRIAAGGKKGKHRGMVFQDSDAAKWLEAVAYSLASRPDPELEKNADELITLIGRAQEADGYLNTYYTLNCPEGKWQNLTEGHELYCAGHFMEAAAAYYETTGKKELLNILCRFADLICNTFGTKEGQCRGYPGHPEVELALVRLFHATGNRRYLETAKYFIDERGSSPNYLENEVKRPDFRRIWAGLSGIDLSYFQAHLPVREQNTAEGHAVRALYLYSAMADIAEEYNDKELLNRCCILWDNIVEKRMYITGSVGSSGHLERFTVDYDLPNDSNYSETCASIALAMFGLRMARITKDASYFDTVERALYNTVRSGISLEGDRYFYVNPLEVWPQTCIDHASRSHIKPVRQKWFDCACCPTNVARTFTGLGHYIYFMDGKELYINLFVSNEVSFEVDGKPVHVSIETDYPKTGTVKIKIKGEGVFLPINIRMPEFADGFVLAYKNGDVDTRKNYYRIVNTWNDEEIIATFSMKSRFVYPNPRVHQNCGKVVIARGPEIFCLEECDNGENLAAVSVDTQTPLEEHWQEDILGGLMTIKARGKRLIEPKAPVSFSEGFTPKYEEATLTALPYGYWGNRSPGEMLVWIRAL